MLPYVYMYLDIIQHMFCLHTCSERKTFTLRRIKKQILLLFQSMEFKKFYKLRVGFKRKNFPLGFKEEIGFIDACYKICGTTHIKHGLLRLYLDHYINVIKPQIILISMQMQFMHNNFRW